MVKVIKYFQNSLIAFILIFVTGSISVAAECSDDPNSCTPKQLCEISTKNIGDVQVWTDSNDLKSHVGLAKSLGINCGNVRDQCDLDPNKCKLDQICKRATILENGKRNWNFDNLDHVVLAKEYGLKCLNLNVDVTKKSKEKQLKKEVNQSLNQSTNTVKLVQTEMNRIGCSLGKEDGSVGPASKRALQQFNNAQGTSFKYDVFFDKSFLATLEKINEKVCDTQKHADNTTGSFGKLQFKNTVWKGTIDGKAATITFSEKNYQAVCDNWGMNCGYGGWSGRWNSLGQGTFRVYDDNILLKSTLDYGGKYRIPIKGEKLDGYWRYVGRKRWEQKNQRVFMERVK